jgi:hypothetical protein
MLGFSFIMETVHVTNLWKIRSSFWKFFKLETVQYGICSYKKCSRLESVLFSSENVSNKPFHGGNPFMV